MELANCHWPVPSYLSSSYFARLSLRSQSYESKRRIDMINSIRYDVIFHDSVDFHSPVDHFLGLWTVSPAVSRQFFLLDHRNYLQRRRHRRERNRSVLVPLRHPHPMFMRRKRKTAKNVASAPSKRNAALNKWHMGSIGDLRVSRC